jgi:hypothetical protein
VALKALLSPGWQSLPHAERFGLQETAGPGQGINIMTGTDFQIGAAPADAGGPDIFHDASRHVSTTIIGLRGSPIEEARKPSALILQSLNDEADAELFQVVVVGEKGATLLVLGPFPGDEAIAIWRSLAATSGLPLVIEGRDGRLHVPYEQIGRMPLGPIRIRRRFAVLSGRRPRFLVRRKAGRLPRRPLVYRERELAGQDAR